MTGPAARTRSRRPFVVMACVLGALILFWALVGVGLMVHPRSRAVIEAAVRFGGAVQDGTEAPGTQALLALGCDQAAVIPVGEAVALLQDLAPEAPPPEVGPEASGISWVYCRNHLGSAASPSCEAVAETYAAEVRPMDRFLVVVRRPGDTQCQGYFDPAGRRMGDVGPNLELESP